MRNLLSTYLLLVMLFVPTTAFTQSLLQKMVDETMDGDTLYLEKNDYVSDNSVTLSGRKNLTLVFEEGATVTCTSQFQDVFVIQNCSDIQLFNGTFRHPFRLDAEGYGSAFYVFQSQSIRLVHADLCNNGAQGLIAQDLSDLELIRCRIRNNTGSAILIQGRNKDFVLKGNRYERNGPTGNATVAYKPPTDEQPTLEELEWTLADSVRLERECQIRSSMFESIRSTGHEPQISLQAYDSAHVGPLDKVAAETARFPAWFSTTEVPGRTNVWISLPAVVNQYLCQASGLTRFDSRDAIEFLTYDEPDFTNLSAKAFLKSMQGEVVYLHETTPTNIHWSCDTELEKMVQELKGKSMRQWTDDQEAILYKLLQVWEKYQTAGLAYDKMAFELVGTARFNRSEYQPVSQQLDVHLQLDDRYVATLRIPMNAAQMRQLFFNRDTFSVSFPLAVRPGYKQIQFNKGNQDKTLWILPNPQLLAKPVIECRNQLGSLFQITADGWTGTLWPVGQTWTNWDKACPTPSNRSYQYLLPASLKIWK